MRKWQSWNSITRIHTLKTMDSYVRNHAEAIGIRYWNDNLKPFEEIVSDDEEYSNIFFVFFVAITTDTSWLDCIVKAIR